LPGETGFIHTATADGGGTVQFGQGCTIDGTLTLTGATGICYMAPAVIVAQAGASLTLDTGVAGLTVTAVTGRSGSNIIWDSDATITTLTLQTGSVFDKSGDVRAMTITNSTIDGDTCQVRDPNSAITWTNATTVNGIVSSGPFQFNTGRTVKIT